MKKNSSVWGLPKTSINEHILKVDIFPLAETFKFPSQNISIEYLRTAIGLEVTNFLILIIICICCKIVVVEIDIINKYNTYNKL